MTKRKMKKSRRILLVIGIVLLILAAAGAGIYFYIRSMFHTPEIEIGEVTDNAIVETTGGTVRGYISNDIYTYHGIPYGHVPERFVAAQPVEPWVGVLDTAEYGPVSPKGSLLGMSGSANGENTANDCLNLNIWTPSIFGGDPDNVTIFGQSGLALTEHTAMPWSGGRWWTALICQQTRSRRTALRMQASMFLC